MELRTDRTRMAILLMLLCGIGTREGLCQPGMGASTMVSYGALNGVPSSTMVDQVLANTASGSMTGSITSVAPNPVHTASGLDWIQADQAVRLNYMVPFQVMIDRGLLAVQLNYRISDVMDAYQSYSDNLPPGPGKDQLLQDLQAQIDDLNVIWESLYGPYPSCPQTSFEGYPAQVNADVKYKDVLSGVRLMRAENGIANLTGIPYSDIAGDTKSTILIYR